MTFEQPMPAASAGVDAADFERRHRALVDRDREIGLMAEAETARADADRVQAELNVVRARLARKNERITELLARVDQLREQAVAVRGSPSLLRRVQARLSARG